MKNMKKIVALLLATVMVMAMSINVFAASIEVKDVIDGEEYTAYKILNYTDNGKTGEERAVSYYLTKDEYTAIGAALEAAGFAFTASADGTQYVLNNADTIDVADAASKLDVTKLGNALGKFGPVEGADGKAEFDGLTAGYYFVTTTAGSFCALHDEKEIATAVEKNTVTTPDKKQGAEAGSYADAKLDVNVGDTVYYDAEIKIGKGANYEITGTDTLSTGLKLNHEDGDITVKVAGTAVPATNYTLTATDNGFTIVFKADYIKTLKETDVIMIEYSAVITEDIPIRQLTPNTWTIDYSNQHLDDHTDVKTYDAQVKKVDATSKQFLAGAGFKLYDAATAGNEIKVAKDDTGYYVSATGTEEIKIESADGANIRGLAPGTYYLEETTVPAGYNKLPERKSFTVAVDATEVAEITVENESGSVLPSTGGIGTTMFYIVGSVLVIGAAVVLISKRRMAR